MRQIKPVFGRHGINAPLLHRKRAEQKFNGSSIFVTAETATAGTRIRRLIRVSS